jgi:hypothetical protein
MNMYSHCKEKLLKVTVNCIEIMRLLMYYNSVMNIYSLLQKEVAESASKLYMK